MNQHNKHRLTIAVVSALTMVALVSTADARGGKRFVASDHSATSQQQTTNDATQQEAMPGEVESVAPAYPVVSTNLVRNSAQQAASDLSMNVNTSNRLLMRPGVNQMIPIAMYHPNRIVTPFKHPSVISTTLSGGTKENECGEVCVRGNVVYISTDKNYPVTAFITEKGNDAVALSLTMIPKRIPPREVELRVPDDIQEKISVGATVTGSETQAEAWEMSMPFVEMVREGFHLMAKGEVPPGYSLRNVRRSDVLPVCRQEGLSVRFKEGQVLVGSKLNVFVGVAENIGRTPVEFREQNCGNWNVAAVAAWPLKVLRPGQKSEVFVAVRPDEKPIPGTVRKSLINREFN